MDSIRFKNGETLKIEDGYTIGNIIHIADNETDALAATGMITRENVEHVEFFKDGAEPHGIYDYLTLVAQPTRQAEEQDGEKTGRVIVMFGLREQTELEQRVATLEESQTLQDGAIEEMADVVSELAEG